MEFFDAIIHIDEYLANIVAGFGSWTYVALFAVIFAETGLVITPFFPGDSLLFAVGTLAGGGLLNVWTAYVGMLIAAILGDTLNYWLGHRVGPRVFSKENSRIFNQSYLEKTREFYEKYGGKAIILARFLPIIRTFAPFVAGIGRMHYNWFLFYNVIGAFMWVTSITFAGYFFGALPLVKNNFEYVIVGIIFFSFLPMVIEYLKYKNNSAATYKQGGHATDYKDIQETFKHEHLND